MRTKIEIDKEIATHEGNIARLKQLKAEMKDEPPNADLATFCTKNCAT